MLVPSRPHTHSWGKKGCGRVSICRALGHWEKLPLCWCPERALGAEPGAVRHLILPVPQPILAVTPLQ